MKIDPESIEFEKTRSYGELIERAAAVLEKNPDLNKVEIEEVGHELIRLETPEEQAALDDKRSIAIPTCVNGITYLIYYP